MNEPGGAVSSTFPLPPMDYVKLYTDENVKANLAPQPPAVSDDSYRTFGMLCKSDDTIILPLEEQMVERVYPQDFSHRQELKKLNMSVVTSFLDLLDILIHSPTSEDRVQKAKDIETLFINMHHLINEYRPHQARECLRTMIAEQVKEKQYVVDKFQMYYDKVVGLIRDSKTFLPNEPTVPETNPGSLPMDILEDSEPAAGSDGCHALDRLFCNLADSIS